MLNTSRWKGIFGIITVLLTAHSLPSSAGGKNPDDLAGYWKKTFADEFRGPPLGTPQKELQRCYQTQPRCIDLYNNWDLPCSSNASQTYPKLAMLNKCVWNVHRSVNWMSPKVNEFSPEQVEVRANEEGGILVLKGNSVLPNGSVRPSGGSSNVKFSDMDNYVAWMSNEGYNCPGPKGEGQQDPQQRKCPIRSGMVTSVSSAGRDWPGFLQQYGLFQVRGTIASGDRAWPAYWMLPNATWPGGGEFDLMESWNEDRASQTFHTGVCIPNGEEDMFPDSCKLDQGKARWHLSKGEDIKYNKTPNEKSFFSNFHNFSLEWNANKINFRTDGVSTNQISEGDKISGSSNEETFLYDLLEWGHQYQKDKKAAHIPRRPFYFLLNHTVGDSKNGPNPINFSEQVLKVDYVRVWQKCSINSDFCPAGGTYGSNGNCSGAGIQTYASPCTRCLYGGVGGNPNCQLRGFNRPEFNPGVSYWVDANPRWPGVYYKKLDQACPAGGAPSDGNCQVKTFGSSVAYVPVPEVNYWVDTNPSWPGIYYKQSGGACVYGGVVSGNGNCQWKAVSGLKQNVQYWVDGNPRWPGLYYHGNSGSCPHGGTPSGNGNCQLQAYSVPATVGITLRPGVQYWMDPDPRWPGIYYKQIQGTCPVGGVTSGNGNCQLVAYPVPTEPYLSKGQDYWVDANPSWPGIYYKQIQGTCRFGGTISGNGNCQLMAFPQGYLEDQIKYFVDSNPRWPGIYYRATY
jgi:beta-glucanase (GH16 family)